MGDTSLHLSFLRSLLLPLCQLLWVSITPQSKWMLGEDYYSQTVKRRRLMSPVFNHHTVEWFYAYFICISLNHASAGHSELERYKVGGREWESENETEGGRSLWCLSSKARDLFHDLSSTFTKIMMTWKPLKLDITLDSSNSSRVMY